MKDIMCKASKMHSCMQPDYRWCLPLALLVGMARKIKCIKQGERHSPDTTEEPWEVGNMSNVSF
eukprot:1161624-Pelagomonas_calceolata.AAC.8